MKLLLTITVLLFAVYFSLANVHYVPGTYTTIQSALNACATGDTVLVAPGIYYENLTWPNTQSISLFSDSGRDVTVIDGGAINRVIKLDVGVDTTTVIKGFTIRNGYDQFGAGIRCIYNSSPTITQNTITYNTAYGPNYGLGGGIGIFSYSSPRIIDNIITYNSADSVGGGISCTGFSNPIIKNNIIRNNEADIGGGIHCFDNANPVISHNFIDSNKAFIKGGGIRCKTFSSPQIIFNNITYNEAVDTVGGGISCSDHSSPLINNNYIAYNSTGGSGGGISCGYNSSPIITYNEIFENYGLAGGGILCVYNSAPNIQFNTIRNNSCQGGGGGIVVSECDSTYIANNLITENIAGVCGGGLALLASTSIIKYNTIEFNTNYTEGGGMWFANGDQSVVGINDINYNNGDGVYCTDGGNPVLNWNNICDNSGYGVRNTDPFVMVDAQYNWWDDPNGPGGVGPGAGDEVSSYVNYAYWLHEPLIIPVELISFTAVYAGGEIILNWETASEINNLGFEIERRIINNEEQAEWMLIGFREGYGTTSEPKEYSYVDKISGINANAISYRLKQIDFNGSYEYSDEVFVDNLAPIDFVLEQNYPNPFNPTTTIIYGLPMKSQVELVIYNALGESVLQLINEETPAGSYEVEFNATTLPSGVYFYQLRAENFVETKKMVLMK
jgi:hypothetical protein